MLPGGIIEKISEGYDKAWKVFIKPESFPYEMGALGPKIFLIGENQLTREDFNVTNKNHHNMVCSVFLPENHTENTLCVIYLHSQTGCRLEGLTIRDRCAEIGVALCVFDFSGCGNSEGDYVSLGWHEQDDLSLVIDNLRDRFGLQKFSLWGRSMGAVTALLYAEKYSNTSDVFISSMILDSPFPELEIMVQDVAGRVLHLPKFIVNLGMTFVSKTIQDKINYDIMELKPILAARKITIPAVFIVGKKDILVRPERVEEMFNVYKGRKKQLVQSENDHGGERETRIYDTCIEFIMESLNHDDFENNKRLKIVQARNPVNPQVVDPSYTKKYGGKTHLTPFQLPQRQERASSSFIRRSENTSFTNIPIEKKIQLESLKNKQESIKERAKRIYGNKASHAPVGGELLDIINQREYEKNLFSAMRSNTPVPRSANRYIDSYPNSHNIDLPSKRRESTSGVDYSQLIKPRTRISKSKIGELEKWNNMLRKGDDSYLSIKPESDSRADLSNISGSRKFKIFVSIL